jgi:hypothetical protein
MIPPTRSNRTTHNTILLMRSNPTSRNTTPTGSTSTGSTPTASAETLAHDRILETQPTPAESTATFTHDRIPESQYPTMAASNLPSTTEGLIQLQAQQATELHEITMEKARAELAILRGKVTAAPVTEDPTAGELAPEALSLLALHPGVSSRQILAILKNTFDPYDLHKLRPGLLQHDLEREQALTILEGQVTVRKKTGQLKDYGDSQTIWVMAFNTYLSLINAIHGDTHPKLIHSILRYIHQILEHAEVYQWQRQVLPMALEHHRLVIATGVTNAENWPIPATTRDRWCNHLLKTSAGPLSKKRSSDGIRTTKQTVGAENTVCMNWNNDGCGYNSCVRKHECLKCGDSGHTRWKCKK